jgi:hypothetical protein
MAPTYVSGHTSYYIGQFPSIVVALFFAKIKEIFIERHRREFV